MPISQELLTKAAKVYEAGEAVDGMKPKEVYESHKKCAPGEFGMNKEGGSVVNIVDPAGVARSQAYPKNSQEAAPQGQPGLRPASKLVPGAVNPGPQQNIKQAVVGTALGALGGAVSGKPGKKLRAVGRGALKGLGTDVGALAGAGTGFIAGLPLFSPLLGMTVGGATGGYLGNKITDSMLGPYESEEEQMDQQLEKFLAMRARLENSGTNSQPNNEKEPSVEKQSAFEFGRKVAFDTGAALNSAIVPLLGAGIGGLGGAMSSKKHRLRNALLGALGGGALGGAAEYALPGLGMAGKFQLQDLFKAQEKGTPATFWSRGRMSEQGKSRLGEVNSLMAARKLQDVPGGLKAMYPSGSPIAEGPEVKDWKVTR